MVGARHHAHSLPDDGIQGCLQVSSGQVKSTREPVQRGPRLRVAPLEVLRIVDHAHAAASSAWIASA